MILGVGHESDGPAHESHAPNYFTCTSHSSTPVLSIQLHPVALPTRHFQKNLAGHAFEPPHRVCFQIPTHTQDPASSSHNEPVIHAETATVRVGAGIIMYFCESSQPNFGFVASRNLEDNEEDDEGDSLTQGPGGAEPLVAIDERETDLQLAPYVQRPCGQNRQTALPGLAGDSAPEPTDEPDKLDM